MQNYSGTLACIGGEWNFFPCSFSLDSIKTQFQRFTSPKPSQIKGFFTKMYPSLKDLPLNEQIFISYDLLRTVPQLKLFAFLLLLKNEKHLTASHIQELGQIVDGVKADYSFIEAFATKLFNPLLSNDALFKEIKDWMNSSSPNRQKICILTFTKYYKDTNAQDIWDVCKKCIRNNDKVVQRSVGTALKELIRSDESKVTNFCKENLTYLTKESLNCFVNKLSDQSIKEEIDVLMTSDSDVIDYSS